MTETEYRQHPAISRSQLWKIKQSPLHFKYALDHPDQTDSKALTFGIAAHMAVLQPELFIQSYVVAPQFDRRTKAGKEAYEAFQAENAGKTVLNAEDYNACIDMACAVLKNPVAAALLSGTTEEEFFWTDDITGEACKCRTDCRSEYKGKQYIVDYKTTDSCQDGHFEASVRKYGYKFQAGMYTEGVTQNDIGEWHFAFVAQEKKPPYAVRVYFCTDEFVGQGYDMYRQLIGIYHDCKQSGNWYGYEGKFNTPAELVGEDET